MRSRFKIEAVVFLLLALAESCWGQTAQGLSRVQTPSISDNFRDANQLRVKSSSDALSTTTASAEEDIGRCRSASRPLLGELSMEFEDVCTETPSRLACLEPQQECPTNAGGTANQPADVSNNIDRDSKSSSVAVARSQNSPEFHHDIYYRNKLEFALDGGWLPINIPFVFDVFLGDAYNKTPLNYTLVPLIASLRWHIDDVNGPWIFRGNWDMTVSGSITLIPRGPETRYFSYDMGIRRNFVPHRGNVAPYLDGRLGLGQIDAKGPLGVSFAQGQNFTFTVNLGSGVRYNFSPRYALSAGLNWMHISNLYLSEPAFSNYGINVYGPMFGLDVRLGRRRHGIP